MKTDSCLPVARTGKVIAVSLLAVAAFTGRSYSQLSLGIDFQGRTPADVSSPAMAATETAGVPGFNFSNWNSVDNHVLGRTATSGPLSYSNGTASGVTISYSSNDEWNGPNAAYNGQLNDDHLYYGIIKQQNVGSSADFTLNNLSGDGTKYDLFVYYLTNNADNADGSAGGRKMDLSLNNGAQIKFVRESTFTYGGSYIEGISTDVNNRDSFASNYAKFSGLSAVDLDGNGSFELKLQAFNQAINDGIGIAGFALIQYAPVSAVKQWNIASGVWDTTTANWLDSNNLASTYLNGQPGDQVVFGNSGAAGARTVTIASPVTPASVTVNNNAGNNYTINGVIGDGGFNSPLTKNGAGELTLTSANTFGGSVLLKHGTVNVATIGDAATDGNLGKGSGITLGDAGGLNDAVLNYTGTSATLARDISVESTGGAINVPASQTLSFNHLTGSGAFTKGGAGNIAFTATSLNGLTGSLTVPAGTLSVAKLGSGSGSISLGSTAAAGLIYGGGSLKDGRSLVVGAGGATITVSNADALYQLAGATTATAGRLTVAGPGRLALDGAAAFAQMPIINAGATLALRNETGNTLPAGPIDVAGGTLELAPGAFTAGTAFNLIGGTLRLGHEGLQGNYYTGGYDQNGLLNALGGTYGGVTGHFANLGDPALTARTNTGGRTDLNFDNTNGGNAAPFADQGLNDTDNIRSSFSGKILITTAGLTGFSTRSDDGSAIFIDGQRVVNNNFFQGMTTRSGTIDLTAGLHDIFVYFYEGGGGAGLDVYYSPVGGAANQIIPNSVLFAGDVFDASGSNVNVTASSKIEVGSSLARLGALAQNAGTTLTVTGSAAFASTTLSGTGVHGIHVSNALDSVNLAQITAGANPVITKSGAGALVFSNAAPPSLTINSQAGLVVIQGSETAGTTINPLASSLINFNGGGLGFSATAGNPLYSTNVNAGTNSYRIEAGSFGSDLSTSQITWAPQSGSVSIGAGATATFNVSEPGYTLSVAAPTSGAGALAIDDGAINFQAGVANGGGLSVKAGTVNVTGAVNTGAVSLVGVLNGVNNLNPSLTVSGNVNATSIDVARGTLHVVGTTTNTGAFSQGAGVTNFDGNVTHGSVAVAGGVVTAGANLTSNGALNITGGSVTVEGSTSASSIAVGTTGDLIARGNVNVSGTTSVANGRSLAFDGGVGKTVTYTGGNINVDNMGTIRAGSGIADLSSASIHIVTPYTETVTADALNAVAINATGVGTQARNIAGVNSTLAATPSVQTLLPNGNAATNNGGIDFPNGSSDGVFNAFFGQTLPDAFTTYFTGAFTAKVGGTHSFRFSDNDDDVILVADTNFNGQFDAGDAFQENTCCGADKTLSADLAVGQQLQIGWFVQDGGGGSGLKGYFQEPAGGTFTSSTIVRPGDAGQEGYWSVRNNNGGGGRLQVDADAELRTKSFDGVTFADLAANATLRLSNSPTPLASNASTINLLDSGSTASVLLGDKHTLSVGRLLLADAGTLLFGKTTGAVEGGTVRINGVVPGITGAAPSDIDAANVQIQAGRLIVNAPVTGVGTLTASISGSIGGLGSVAGTVAATAGGRIEPGDEGVGLFSAGNLTINGGALRLDISDTLSHDVLRVLAGGTVALGTGSTLEASFLNLNLAIGDVIYVIDNQGSNPVTGLFNGVADQGTIALSGLTFQISYDASLNTDFNGGGNDVALKLAAIPEPGSLLVLLGGLGGLAGLQRFRRRTS